MYTCTQSNRMITNEHMLILSLLSYLCLIFSACSHHEDSSMSPSRRARSHYRGSPTGPRFQSKTRIPERRSRQIQPRIWQTDKHKWRAQWRGFQVCIMPSYLFLDLQKTQLEGGVQFRFFFPSENILCCGGGWDAWSRDQRMTSVDVMLPMYFFSLGTDVTLWSRDAPHRFPVSVSAAWQRET